MCGHDDRRIRNVEPFPAEVTGVSVSPRPYLRRLSGDIPGLPIFLNLHGLCKDFLFISVISPHLLKLSLVREKQEDLLLEDTWRIHRSYMNHFEALFTQSSINN